MAVWLQVLLVMAILSGTALALVLFQRSLNRPGGRRGHGGIHDAMGNLIDVFEPSRARADRELQRHQDAGPVSRTPDDEDEAPLTLLTRPDGSPRAARVRRPR